MPNRSALMQSVRIFLSGDVMTGRGIDQVLPYPCDPVLQERYVQSAEDYVRLAELANGPVARPVSFAYVWGDALGEWRRLQPHLKIINLETSITRSSAFAPKGINYRMSPENAECLKAAGIDCCILANNHVLDFGSRGLAETLQTLARHDIKFCGAGNDLEQAATPTIHAIAGRVRVVVFSYALDSSGTPAAWAAKPGRPGVNFLAGLSDAAVDRVAGEIEHFRQPGDIVVVSIHWGPNWGYEIPAAQRRFAHALINRANISIIHGHSSHHPKAIEVYRDRLILYGCGDFLNDYEGISGYEEFRGDLSLMYFAEVEARTGALEGLDLVVMQIRQFRLNAARDEDTAWSRETLARESAPFGGRFEQQSANRFRLKTRP